MTPLSFLRLVDVPLGRLRICRAFPLASLIVVATPVMALSAWAWWTPPHNPATGMLRGLHALWHADGYVLAVGALFWAVAANDARKALCATGWLAAVGRDGLFVKWRSYQNRHWGTDDIQVVCVPLDAIRSARVLNRLWVTPAGRHGGARSEPARYVELSLAPGVDMASLAQHLANERAGKPNGRSIGWKGLWGELPVSVEQGSVLRIRWRAWPRADAFVEELREHGVATAASRTDEIDFHARGADAELRELARTGDVIALVRALRARDSSLSLTDAKVRATALIASSRT